MQKNIYIILTHTPEKIFTADRTKFTRMQQNHSRLYIKIYTDYIDPYIL